MAFSCTTREVVTLTNLTHHCHPKPALLTTRIYAYSEVVNSYLAGVIDAVGLADDTDFQTF